ncbi:MAG: tRNA (cytidine(34)-2'-O)-methyltransferase [Alphaproteobacteria bacterium]
MRLALYQPDIPQNTGTLIRLGACLGAAVDIIGPCGFPVSDKALKRAALDYADAADIRHHRSWSAFLEAPERRAGRLVLLTTQARRHYTEERYGPGDTLLLGSESAGAPPFVHDAADSRVRIPLRPGLRSLNVAVAASMVLGEALRQTGGFPAEAAATTGERP